MAALTKFDIAGKHAIVTGGAQGLSRGMAEGLLEAGCKEKVEKVCEESRAKGLEAYSVIGNLADRADLNRAFDEALQILDGRLDVLVPAAGIQRRYLPEEFPAEQWDLVMKINLDHVWFMIQRSLQVMLKQPTGGKIITIGSMASYFGCTTVPAYTATKGAVAQLTKSVAVDCAGRGININCICPGYFPTEMTAAYIDAPFFNQAHLECCPMERHGKTGEMDGLCTYFASPACSYTTGQIVCVDGGWSAI